MGRTTKRERKYRQQKAKLAIEHPDLFKEDWSWLDKMYDWKE